MSENVRMVGFVPNKDRDDNEPFKYSGNAKKALGETKNKVLPEKTEQDGSIV